ncbi:hypothetical protein [Desertivirga xinjiangensis]
MLFGGESYQKPIFAEGPFVMNSKWRSQMPIEIFAMETMVK